MKWSLKEVMKTRMGTMMRQRTRAAQCLACSHYAYTREHEVERGEEGTYDAEPCITEFLP